MINPSVSPQVNNLSAETRNFKMRERGIVLLRFTKCLAKSLADASGYDDPLCFRTLDLP